MEMKTEQAVAWIEKANALIQSNKEYLTELDQAIGDGDHGLNMSRGFQEAEAKVSGTDYDTVADVFKDVATVLMSKIGGASGPLYGTAFLKMSMTVKDKDPVTEANLADAVEAALNGMKQRGKAEQGEKTMIDVWHPVADFLKNGQNVQADKLEETAERAMNETKDIVATKGRAAYLQERSKGHVDPGSTSSFYLFQALADVWKKGE
ncbi:dihydroxyacetone kinase subunit DhaL [Salimicrobium halophilum]|uniref:phosphoenolpyruvate--glycerone phosphotransferase n=1 Tax=Salimicrobium halophilum TaxID=86666 RepID=A0A1G8WLG6_9BACI|nr:dihydroxyacetone kinase subunit DhaL [Salimicrobium halophilum]SDJ79021.1 dihydroxyacetone kinase DhaL subunit [Salimicrobium halophilum]